MTAVNKIMSSSTIPTCKNTLSLRSASIDNYIAVLGAAKRYSEEQLVLGYRIGKAVAQIGKFLLTGATTGIPYAAAIGACDHGGFVLGISPASNPNEHRNRYGKPDDFHHTIIYTGLGNDGRSPLIVRSASIALFIGGEAGTLHEFTAAWLNGTPILGVLTGSGGIADELPRLAASFSTSFGSRLVVASDPVSLVETSFAALLESSNSRKGTISSEASSVENNVHDILASFRPSVI